MYCYIKTNQKKYFIIPKNLKSVSQKFLFVSHNVYFEDFRLYDHGNLYCVDPADKGKNLSIPNKIQGNVETRSSKRKPQPEGSKINKIVEDRPRVRPADDEKVGRRWRKRDVQQRFKKLHYHKQSK